MSRDVWSLHTTLPCSDTNVFDSNPCVSMFDSYHHIGADRTIANSDGKQAYQLASDPAAATLLRDRRTSAMFSQSYITPAGEDGEGDSD